MNSIGPVWDGNEVWLLTGGGALFAAFPPVYATVFSGLYIALMLVLLCLIARGTSMEFRSKVESPRWRRAWDIAFGLGSGVAALLFGVAFGNILRGLPINSERAFVGSFIGLLNPYSLLIGVLTLSLFTMHGAIYLTLKSEGDLHERAAALVLPLYRTTLVLYIIATTATIIVSPFLMQGAAKNPLVWILFIPLLVALTRIAKYAKPQAAKYGSALIASSAAILCMMGLAGVSLFPRLVPSRIDLANSLTIHNSSSTQRTLLTMLVIALVGMPLVIAYTAIIYRAFKGKVVLGEESY